MTLAKNTDTPKAKAAPTAPTAPAYKPTAERAAEFVALCKAGDELIIARIKHVRSELASGATVGGLASTYSIALTKAGMFVPKTLQPSISQASTASTRASLVVLSNAKSASPEELDSVILSASQLVNVLKKNVEPFISGFKGTAAQFKLQVKALIKRDTIERKKGKPATTPATPTVDNDGEPTVTVTAEKSLPEVISPLEDARKLLKQYRAILDLLVDNSPEDYSMAVDMVLEFSSEYEFEDAE
jgi:hypothetical protein